MPSPGINPFAGQTQTARNWNTAAVEIGNARRELSKYESIMTPYERQTISKSIQEQVERDYSMIYQGAKAYLFEKTAAYKRAVDGIELARRGEINSWDSGKLGTEMHTFQMRIDQEARINNEVAGLSRGPDFPARVKKLYREAQDSGDRYKERAAAEVLRGINIDKMPKEKAVEIRMLIREAEADLDELRITPQMQNAVQEINKAAEELFKARDIVVGTAEVMGEDPHNIFAVGELTKLTKTVQVDRNTGAVKLYDLDSQEVTGVYWKPPVEDDSHNPLTIGGD